MIAAGSSLGLGMSLLVAVWTADPAEAPQEYRFGDQIVVVQPGPVAARMEPRPRQTPAAAQPIVQLAHQVREIPPLSVAPETVQPSPSDFTPATIEPNANGMELSRKYREIYNSIPFDRAEYEANPSYRHDAAMEMLFGKMRPTVVQRSQSTINVNSPPTPTMAMPYSPYGFNSYFFPFFSPGIRVRRSF